MARRHYWQFLVTDEGNPIENAEITIYIAGTEDTAYVYLDEVGGTAVNTEPQTFTSRKGYFEFWIADTTESNGYFFDQKFKIGWKSPGVSAGYIDYIDVFSTSVAEVDVTSTDPLKNKAVSNLLAKGWEDHMSLSIGVGGVVSIHGITSIDERQYDNSLPENTKFNKLVSNIMGNNWETHSNTKYDPISNDWRFYYSDDPTNLLDVDIAGGPGNPHGIEFIDLTSTDTEINKLISNSMGKKWEDHITGVTDDHLIYSRVDGLRDYTARVGYISNLITFDSLGPNDFITKDMLQSQSFYQDMPQGSWTNNGDGTYTYQVVHQLGSFYPFVIVWSGGEVIQPMSIVSISNDITAITVEGDIHCSARITI